MPATDATVVCDGRQANVKNDKYPVQADVDEASRSRSAGRNRSHHITAAPRTMGTVDKASFPVSDSSVSLPVDTSSSFQWLSLVPPPPAVQCLCEPMWPCTFCKRGGWLPHPPWAGAGCCCGAGDAARFGGASSAGHTDSIALIHSSDSSCVFAWQKSVLSTCSTLDRWAGVVSGGAMDPEVQNKLEREMLTAPHLKVGRLLAGAGNDGAHGADVLCGNVALEHACASKVGVVLIVGQGNIRQDKVALSAL